MLRAFGKFAIRLVHFASKYRAGLLISSSVCLLSLALYVALYWVAHPHPALQLLADIEHRTLDMRFQLRGPRPPNPAVLIVAIDQKSQDVLGRWPFPRSHFAEAVNFLREAQARVIAFDVNFPQPDQNSALEALRQVRKEYEVSGKGNPNNPSFEARLKRLEEEADNDRKFAEALSGFENAILGYFLLPESETRTQNQALVKEFLDYLSFQAYPQIVNPEYANKFEGKDYTGLSPNLPAFALYAKNFGYFNVVPDSDGVVRREPVVVKFRESFYPSLDMAATLAYRNQPLDQVAVVFDENGLERVDLGTLTVPTSPDGFAQIDFHGRAGTFPTISLSDI